MIVLPLLCLSMAIAQGANWGRYLFFGVSVGSLVFLNYWQRRKARIKAQRIALSNPEEVIGGLARRVSLDSERECWPVLVRRLFAEGYAGKTFRAHPGTAHSAVEPIDVPFEPRLLVAGRRRVPVASIMSNATDCPWTSTTGDQLSTHEARFTKRLFRSNIVLLIAAGMMLLILFVESLQAGAFRPDWSLGNVLVLVAFAIIAWTRISIYSSAQFLAIPGGLVYRTSTWWRRDWQMHVFNRRSSVWLAAKSRHGFWDVNVADADTHAKFVVLDGEFGFALRAWLSPLEPPAVEVLSDLE